MSSMGKFKGEEKNGDKPNERLHGAVAAEKNGEEERE